MKSRKRRLSIETLEDRLTPATGSVTFTVAGYKFFANTNITFSTTSSGSLAFSEASMTAAQQADTLNGGFVSTTLNDAFDGDMAWGTGTSTGGGNEFYVKNGPLASNVAGAGGGDNGRVITGKTQTLANGLQINVSDAVYSVNVNGKQQPVMRQILTVKNPTNAPITKKFFSTENLGSDSNTRIFATSSSPTVGSPIFNSTTDRWVASFQNFSGTTSSDPREVHVLRGPGNPKVVNGTDSTFVNGDDNPLTTYTLTLQPGETQKIMRFVALTATRQQTIDLSTQLFDDNEGLRASGVLAGLTTTDLQQIVNWDFDSVAPTATLGTAPDVDLTSDPNTYQFTVNFADNKAVDVSTIASGAVTVTGPGGFSQNATLVSVSPNTDGTPRTATFSIVPPGGSWDQADNGLYSIAMVGGVVKDTDGNPVAAGVLGSFSVGTIPVDSVLQLNPLAGFWVGVGAPPGVQERLPGDDSDQAFVRKLYADVLGRAPDDEGFANTLNDLQSHSRADIIAGMLNSHEFHGRAVQQMYRSFLHREADSTGLEGYVAILDGGASLEDVAADILSSTEYSSLHPSNQDFVNGVFTDVLGRPADPDAAAVGYVTALDSGATTRADVVKEVLNSDESRGAILKKYYGEFLHRQPDEDGLSAYLASRDRAFELAGDILGSDEFLTARGPNSVFDPPFNAI